MSLNPRGMRGLMLILSLLSLSSCSLAEGRHHHQKVSSAVVVGRVYCDTCFQDDVSKGSHYISGATVAVECKEGSTRPAFYREVKTDNQGTFKVNLPFSVSKHVREIEGCNVKLVKSSEPYCAVVSTASSSAIHLKERKRGRHIFSAGFFTFKPLKQPGLCNQQPSVTNSQLNSIQDLLPNPEIPSFPTPNPSIAIVGPNVPLMPNLPTLPKLPPLPQLPPLPGLPGLPGFPSQSFPQIPTEQKEQVEHPQQFFPFPPIVPPILTPPSSSLPLPPNPLQPAPLVPNPFQPPAPPLIPNPFQPPTPPLIPNPFQPPTPPPSFLPPLPQVPPLPNLPLPPVPGVTPTPLPSPPPPSLPLPPLPFPPLIPGVGLPVPPASVKPKKATP